MLIKLMEGTGCCFFYVFESVLSLYCREVKDHNDCSGKSNPDFATCLRGGRGEKGIK